MFSRFSSYRVFVSLIAIFAIAAVTVAANWGGNFAGLNFFALSAAAGQPEPQAAQPFTVGTCDTAGPIEIESSGGTTTPTAYASLGAALAAINAGTHTGTIAVEVCGNTDELAVSAVLNASGSGSASYTAVTIAPAGGASRTITGAPAAGSPLIDLNGADNVIINGVGTGGNALSISNTTVSGTASTSTIRFINDASNNAIQNTTVNGSGSGTATGTILFSTTTGTTGNDNNTVTLSNIGPAGANLPLNAILGNGSAANPNNGIIVSNNNIFDFFSAATDGPRGVLAGTASDGWSITGNSFYQTATRTFTGTVVMRAVSIENTSGGGFTISNNFIGGSAPLAGGTAWTQAGAVSHNFIGIRISTGTTVVNSVQGNTIQNISITNSSTSSVGSGISVPSGSANIGTSAGNTIGSQSTTGNIVQTNASAGFFTGILSQPGTLGTLNITNNSIGGITVAGAGAQSLRGIRIETGTSTGINITGNTIGSNTTANSMQSNGNAPLMGISSTNASTITTVTGNTVRNFQLTSTGTSATAKGIEVIGSFSGQSITGNTIRDFSSASTSTSTTGTAAAVGIVFTGTATSNNLVSNNTIRDMVSTAGTAVVYNLGIAITGTPATTISRNNIFNLSTASTSTTSSIVGVHLFNSAATETLQNNMIRLGTDVSTSLNPIIRGIYDNSATGSPSIIRFNTIYIGGTQGAATVNSACINRVLASTMDVRNNILWNARSSTGAPGSNTGRHYAVWSTVNTGTLTTNFNNLFANGASGATVGFLTSDRVTLADWQGAGAGFDTNSISTDPLVVDAINASSPNLHLQASNPESNAGATIAAVTDDFDGEARPQPVATNPDIGADEGVFTVSTDLQAPTILYTPLPNTAGTGDRALAVSVTDNVGVPTAGLGLPVVYYRKNAGSYVATQCTFVTGSTYSCTITSATLGGVTTGDVIDYYVAAQDTAGLVSVNPSAGAAGLTANPPAAATPPTTPNTYSVALPISGDINVGSGETFTSLTKNDAAGLFRHINTNVVTGNIVIHLTSDLTIEDGVVGLNAFDAPHTITIKPDGGARIISGAAAATALIRGNGASRFIIDGSTSGGTDRSLTITNTSVTTPQVVRFGNIGTTPITNNTLKNTIIINGVNTSSAVVLTDTAGAAGYFTNITIQNNDIQKAFIGVFGNAAVIPGNGSGTTYTQNKIDSTGANAILQVGLYAQGIDGATISQNTIGNFAVTDAATDTGIWLATATANTTISGNTVSNIGYTGTTAVRIYGIRESTGVAASGNIIRGNSVSNISNNSGESTLGIAASGGGVTIDRNNVQNIINTSTSTFGAYGIDVQALNNCVVKNNFVSGINHDMTGGAAFSTTFGVFGIRIGAGTGHQIYNNSVNMSGAHTGVAATSLLSGALAIVTTASTGMDIRNNIFANNMTGGTTSIAHVSVALPSGGTSAMGLTWNNNSYYYGTDAARQGIAQVGVTAGTTFFTTLPALTAYTSTLGSATNDNASMASTGAVPFVSSSDLHLVGTPPEVNAAVTIGSVTNDFDGNPRPAGTAAEIGADELTDAVAPDTSITGNPTNPSNSSNATFTFTGTDARPAPEVVASFECKLDGGAFAACTSPKNYTSLGQGSHTFEVRAVDTAGNVDPIPASYTWSIDAIAPDTQITGNPPAQSNDDTPTFTFTGTDSIAAGIPLTFECKMDAGAFSSCISPFTSTPLAAGSHTFQVRATDSLGNTDATPASYTWFIDLTAPDTQILTTPTDPSSSADATFTFTGSDSLAESLILTWECKLDAGAFAACTSPKTYLGLGDGSHTFQVRTIDEAGNVDLSPASFTWTITTAPAGNVSVTATAGTTGPTSYTTLKDAIDAINGGTHQGAITVSVNASTTETATSVLNGSGAGSASYTTILIRPTVDAATVAGPSAAGRGLIELNGADNVTIDGDNPNTGGTNRNLTFQNTAANTVTFSSVVRVAVAATGVTSADNCTIRNLNLAGNATGRNIGTATSTTGSENTVFGVFAGPGASTGDPTIAPAAVASVATGVAAGATATNLVVSNNAVTNAGRGISINGAAATVFPGLQITGNSVGNPTAAAADQVYSIGITAQGSANGVISGNTVWVEGFIASSTGGHGIEVGVNSAVGTFTIDSNKVNRVRNSHPSTFSAYGINLGGSNNHVVQNNFVAGVMNDQTAGTGAFSTLFGAMGIRIGVGTGHKIYHNSVNMYGALPGIVSTNLTMAFALTVTGNTGVDVRNNIFANQITGGNPAGASTRHAAVFLPAAATSALNLTWNNNAYYQGADPKSRLAQVGATGGTGEFLAANFDPTQTTPATNLRSYTSTLSVAGTNDNASFASSTAPPFTSNIDLHIPAATATRLESGGAAIGVGFDIDVEARNPTTPDIGADEFAGLPAPANDMAASSFITPTNGANVSTGVAFSPQASFTNNGTATQTAVTVRYRILDPSTAEIYNQTASIPTIAPLATVTVTFPSTSLTVAGVHTIEASAELVGDANIANDKITGSVTAVVPLNGSIDVGTGQTYTSLTNAGGVFEALNIAGAGSNITLNITSDLTAETGAVALNQLPGGFGLTIKPSGAARTISGNGAALSLIKLNGADNVTIDGSLSGGNDQSLTITYGNTGGTVIWIAAQNASNGASNNTVKNTVLSGNTGVMIISGILAGSGTTLGGAAEAQNNNNTITNNRIFRVQNSVFSIGAVAFDQNWNISNNTFSSTVAADKSVFRGMLLGNAQNFIINGNTVLGVQSTAATTAAMSGIQLATTVNGGFVVNNRITDIKNVSTAGTGAFGMQLSATSAAANVTIANNFISDVAATGSATVAINGHGITVNGTGAGGYKIYHNSINLNTNQASGTTAALNLITGLATGGIDVRDNILANTQTAGATRYSVFSASPATVFSSIDYNDYFSAQNVGNIGATARVTLADWQTATGQDVNSFAVDPMFFSSTELHLAAGSPMINAAFTLAAVTSDIDGQSRPIGAANDVGADEWTGSAKIEGRMLTAEGQGLKNVSVRITGAGLPAEGITFRTGPLGYFSFPNLTTGVTYSLLLKGSRATFTPNSANILLFADTYIEFKSNESGQFLSLTEDDEEQQ